MQMWPNISRLLRRFPSLHSAAKAFYTRRLISESPAEHPRGFKLIGPSSMRDGSFEPNETSQLVDLLKDTAVFVNVGANIGYYVCIARSCGVHVVAVEPLDRNLQILKKNLDLNDWRDVEVFPIGLAASPSIERIFGGGTAASFVPGWAGAKKESYELVPLNTLDNLVLNRFAGESMLILMDVEGFELNVLTGADWLLRRNPPAVWFVEICIDEHQPDHGAINPNLRRTFEAFWKHGYKAEMAGNSIGPVTENDVDDWVCGSNLPATHNFIFRKY
jgi:FkbM family methyltransferase